MSAADTTFAPSPSLWGRLPLVVRAVVSGLLVCLPAANLIAVLAILVRMSSLQRIELFAALEAAFLLVYLWWTRGGGAPRSTKRARALSSRSGRFSARQWRWALAAGIAFAIVVHAALVVAFRLVPFPAAAFHQGYDFSMIPSLPLKALAVVLAAASAAITEETGFRGYMQQPIEERHGAFLAISVSTIAFVAAHLGQSWAVPAMNPIVALGGVLLGLLAFSSKSLIPGFIAHTLMDIGLFGYWWTGIAGTFSARTIAETGIDAPFAIAGGLLAGALIFLMVAMRRLWILAQAGQARSRW